MMNPFVRLPQFQISASVLRMVTVSFLASTSLLSGLAFHSSDRPNLRFNAAAVAQSPNLQVGQYVRAAYEIEQMRQRDYAEAKRIMGGNVPGDVCRQQDIPAPVRDICSRFLSNSTEIIKKNGLSISQFNDLTRRKAGDPALQQQIQTELVRLQKAAP